MRALVIVLLALATAGTARADGLPVLGIDVGGTGITTQGSPLRYVTVPAGGSTVVEAVERNGGRIDHIGVIPGTFTIPAVAYDWSPGGLSADGKTLVLIEPRSSFPRATTRLVVLDTKTFRQLTPITLRGDFSFDAVSPHGKHIVLINYTNAADPTRYAVRAYDVEAGRLRARPVVDPHEPGEKMRGNPVSRATGPGGRWAYTLYDGAGGTPFIHALDTSSLTARCIDLDELRGTQVSSLRLRIGGGGGAVDVVGTDGRSVLTVDRATYAVKPPVTPQGTRFPWLIAAIAGAALLAALALVAASLRSRRGAAAQPPPRRDRRPRRPATARAVGHPGSPPRRPGR
jgi:hypothetical protein